MWIGGEGANDPIQDGSSCEGVPEFPQGEGLEKLRVLGLPVELNQLVVDADELDLGEELVGGDREASVEDEDGSVGSVE